MNLLFSFLEPTRSHSALLAGYFSKVYINILFWFAYYFCQCGLSDLRDTDLYAILQVVVCLMIRKTVPLMNYVQVSKTLCFRSTVVDCLFNFMEQKKKAWLNFKSNPFYVWNLCIKPFLVYSIVWCACCMLWSPCEIIHSWFNIISTGPSECFPSTCWFDRNYIHYGGKFLPL